MFGKKLEERHIEHPPGGSAIILMGELSAGRVFPKGVEVAPGTLVDDVEGVDTNPER